MQSFRAKMIAALIVLLATQLTCHAEWLDQWFELRRRQEMWDFSYMKLFDLLEIDSTLGGWDRNEIAAKAAAVRVARAESRCIVTRKQNARMPTWNGSTPAVIVDPTIWYFDPESRREDKPFAEALVVPMHELPKFQTADFGRSSPRTFLNFLLQDQPRFTYSGSGSNSLKIHFE